MSRARIDNSFGSRMRRTGAILIVLCYTAATVWCFGLHFLGDPGVHPTGYFFVWDMFPFYSTDSFRVEIIGRTRSSKVVRLHPGPTQQYRRGVRGDMTRLDLERSRWHLRKVAESLADRADASAPHDPVQKVEIVERYWVPKFNYFDDLYEAEYGEPRRPREYWRPRESFERTGGAGP